MSAHHPEKLTDAGASIGGGNPSRQSRRAIRGQQPTFLRHRHAVAICNRGRPRAPREAWGWRGPVPHPYGADGVVLIPQKLVLLPRVRLWRLTSIRVSVTVCAVNVASVVKRGAAQAGAPAGTPPHARPLLGVKYPAGGIPGGCQPLRPLVADAFTAGLALGEGSVEKRAKDGRRSPSTAACPRGQRAHGSQRRCSAKSSAETPFLPLITTKLSAANAPPSLSPVALVSHLRRLHSPHFTFLCFGPYVLGLRDVA